MSDAARGALQGSIDEPAHGSAVAGGLTRVLGWALDPERLLGQTRLIVDGGVGSPVRMGLMRPDVAAAFPGVAHAEASGFEAAVDLRAAGPTARIALLTRQADERWTEVAATEVRVVAPGRPLDGARARAAFTIVHDEARWLELWLRHYGRDFAPQDLYVLDHGSTDGSTRGLGGRCHVIPVHRRAAFDHQWLRTVVEDFHAFLLRSHDVVLFAEVDELIVADPLHHAGLGAYLDALHAPAARCMGFNVVQQSDEPALDFDAPLLAQRAWWHASLEYSKRLVGRVPLRWSDGFHREFNAPDDPPDPALLLIHLHRADYDTCLARHAAAAARDWNAEDVERTLGSQNRISEPEAFAAWFRHGADLDTPRERIPDHLRALV